MTLQVATDKKAWLQFFITVMVAMFQKRRVVGLKWEDDIKYNYIQLKLSSIFLYHPAGP